MKRFTIGIVLLILLFAVSAVAHPPSELNPEFDHETNIFSVEVVHGVGGGSTSHYIEEVTVVYEGEEVVLQRPGRQLTDAPTFLYYMPDVQTGDQLEVTAICNVAGQRTVEFTVPEPEPEDE